MSFSGKVAFVSGAGGGMGFQIALDLLSQGARVCLFDLKPAPEILNDVVGDYRYIQGDLTNENEVSDAVKIIADEFGRIDLLANVAGALIFDQDTSALDIDLAVWDRVMDLNLKSMVHTTRHVVPYIKKQGAGAMVHFSSTQCLRGDAAPQDAYQAAKAGVIAFSKSLAIQLASQQIRSNVIVPGPCVSPMQERWENDPDTKKATAKMIPLGRVGEVEDMSNACLFLLSDRASFITGTELHVDGGLLARP